MRATLQAAALREGPDRSSFATRASAHSAPVLANLASEAASASAAAASLACLRASCTCPVRRATSATRGSEALLRTTSSSLWRSV